MKLKPRSIITCLLFMTTGLLTGACSALGDYTTFGSGFGSKWGDPVHGTTSDVITWSFMSQATVLVATHPLSSQVQGGSNISLMRSNFDAIYGTNAYDTTIQNAFNTWSTASGGRVTFQQVADNGAIAGDSSVPASSAVDIRIGAFNSVVGSGFAGIGAVGYGPPGNDLNLGFRDALAGDILFNLNSQFFRAPGNEGEVFYTSGTYQNDLEGLTLHELGHAAIGLGHSNNNTVPGLGDVMYVDNFPLSVNFVNRQLSSQDLAGLQSVYGITAVPEPSSLVFGTILALGMGSFFLLKLRPQYRCEAP